MTHRNVCLLPLFLFGFFLPAAAAVPAWLNDAASIDLPQYDKQISHLVLHRETAIVFDGKDSARKEYRSAIKILSKDGKQHATAQLFYEPDTFKISKFDAWLLLPDGKVKKYGKKETIDMALVSNDLYNTVRSRVISAATDAVEGAVFGFQINYEEKPIFGQLDWLFQNHEPALRSQLSVELPADWTVESFTFNHPEIIPTISNGTHTWELRNLPHIQPEPLAPSITNVAPRLALSLFPGAVRSTPLLAFKTWREASRWLSEVKAPQVITEGAVAQKAAELVSGVSTEREKIAAIARFVQGINYVSIQIGLGKGGGYRPHPANVTLARRYGDCKDKTNLMRSLLQAAGIASYPVTIYSGDRYYVQREWPSLLQFNHCIIAIVVSEPIDAPAVITHDRLGPLLLFDPTDRYTLLGDYPESDQGGYALLIADEYGDLFRIPKASAENNRMDRLIDLELTEAGSIRARIRETTSGHTAAIAREQFSRLTPDAFQEMIEGWIARTVRRAEVEKVAFHTDDASGLSTLEVEFSAARYAQAVKDDMLLFIPAVVSRRDSIVLAEPKRNMPVVTEAEAFAETVRVKMPSGFAVEDPLKPLEVATDFGRYHSECSRDDEGLLCRRSLVIDNDVIPAERYDNVRGFFRSVYDGEQTPLVLVRK